MTYERMLSADALCDLAATIAVNHFQPLPTYGPPPPQH